MPLQIVCAAAIKGSTEGTNAAACLYTSVFRGIFVSQWDKAFHAATVHRGSPLLPHHSVFLTGKRNATLRFIWNWIAEGSSHCLMLCFPSLVLELDCKMERQQTGFFSSSPEGFRWHSQHGPSSWKGCVTNYISKSNTL